MNSIYQSNFEGQLNDILRELQSYKGNDRAVLTQAINQRLTESLQTYYKELSATFEYLRYRDEINLMNKYERVMR